MAYAYCELSFLDLFAGAGGLYEGFVSAGYQPIAHVEMDTDACNTLKTRECFHYLQSTGKEQHYTDYLKKRISREQLYSLVPRAILDSVICETMSDDTMPSVFSRVDVALKARGCGHIDFILGGPPCQAYSTVGRSRKNMDGDPRNTLYKLYFQALERYQPTMFVFENVPGLLTAGGGSYLTEIVSGFKERGYELEKHILNAADYGVLQNRKRIILIGWKKGSGHYYPKLNKSVKKYRVNDLFEDLPTLMPGEEKDYYCKDVINEYGLQLNAYALSEDFSSLDIFVSVLSENNSPKSISQTDIDAAIKRGVQLYQKAINDLYTSFERDKEV